MPKNVDDAKSKNEWQRHISSVIKIAAAETVAAKQ